MARTPEGAGRLGEAFVEALRGRDFVRLEALLDPQIRFRALVPPGLRTAEDPASAVAHLGRWFGEADRFDLIASAVDNVGPRVHVSYRIRLRETGVWYIVEQQAYLDARDDRVGSADLLCSGFIRESKGIDGPIA